jgi:hypothetical protein
MYAYMKFCMNVSTYVYVCKIYGLGSGTCTSCSRSSGIYNSPLQSSHPYHLRLHLQKSAILQSKLTQAHLKNSTDISEGKCK